MSTTKHVCLVVEILFFCWLHANVWKVWLTKSTNFLPVVFALFTTTSIKLVRCMNHKCNICTVVVNQTTYLGWPFLCRQHPMSFGPGSQWIWLSYNDTTTSPTMVSGTIPTWTYFILFQFGELLEFSQTKWISIQHIIYIYYNCSSNVYNISIYTHIHIRVYRYMQTHIYIYIHKIHNIFICTYTNRLQWISEYAYTIDIIHMIIHRN